MSRLAATCADVTDPPRRRVHSGQPVNKYAICLPFEAEGAYPMPPTAGCWNGTVWRAVAHLRTRRDLDVVVGDWDWGLGIVRTGRTGRMGKRASRARCEEQDLQEWNGATAERAVEGAGSWRDDEGPFGPKARSARVTERFEQGFEERGGVGVARGISNSELRFLRD